MNWPIESHLVTDLFLDKENIRLPYVQENQSALINDLFENEDVLEIAKSYSKFGLYPDEYPIAIKKDGKIVVIEGNRRVAALKGLLSPEAVPKFENQIRKLRNPNINSIPVVIAPSKEEALQHIANRHTITQRRPWRPLRQAFFYKSELEKGKTIEELIQAFPGQDVVGFIRRLEAYHLAKSIDYDDPNTGKIVHDERKFQISTLERFLEDKNIRQNLGFAFNDKGEVEGKIAKEEFVKGYKKLVSEIANGNLDSRNSNDSKARKENFLDKLRSEERPNLENKGSFTSRNFNEIKLDAKAVKTPSDTERSKKTPKGLFLASNMPFKVDSESLHLIYKELRDINVHEFPNAAHDLLRSFLECSLLIFLEKTGELSKIKKGDEHNPKLSELLTYIASEGCETVKDSLVKQIIKQIKTDYTEAYSLERLNMRNHNQHWASTEKDVRAAWAKMEPLFRILLNP